MLKKRADASTRNSGYIGINMMGISSHSYKSARAKDSNRVPLYAYRVYKEGKPTNTVKLISVDKHTGNIDSITVYNNRDTLLLYTTKGYAEIDTINNRVYGKNYVKVKTRIGERYVAVFRLGLDGILYSNKSKPIGKNSYVYCEKTKAIADSNGYTIIYYGIDKETLVRLSLEHRGFIMFEKNSDIYAPYTYYKGDTLEVEYKGILYSKDFGDITESVNLQQFICDTSNKHIDSKDLGNTWVGEKEDVIKVENSKYLIYASKDWLGLYSTEELYLPLNTYTINRDNKIIATSCTVLCDMVKNDFSMQNIPMVCDTVHEMDSNFVGSIKTDRKIDGLFDGAKHRDIYITGAYRELVGELVDLIEKGRNKRVYIQNRMEHSDVLALIKCAVVYTINKKDSTMFSRGITMQFSGYDKEFIKNEAIKICADYLGVDKQGCYDEFNNIDNLDEELQNVGYNSNGASVYRVVENVLDVFKGEDIPKFIASKYADEQREMFNGTSYDEYIKMEDMIDTEKKDRIKEDK